MARTNNSVVGVPTMPLQFPTSTYPKNFSRTARNYHDDRVGGMIFTCSHETRDECLEKKLFGLSFSHYSRVKNIKPGLPLFLLNLSDRKLHGIFEAASHGKMYIDRKAWTRKFSESTPQPAQVRIRIKRECLPLEEKMYSKVIEKYDHTKPLSWFELNLEQTKVLLELFEPLSVRNQQRMVWKKVEFRAKALHDNWSPDPHNIETPTVNRDSQMTKKVESLTPRDCSSSDSDPKWGVIRVPGSDQTSGYRHTSGWHSLKGKSKNPISSGNANWFGEPIVDDGRSIFFGSLLVQIDEELGLASECVQEDHLDVRGIKVSNDASVGRKLIGDVSESEGGYSQPNIQQKSGAYPKGEIHDTFGTDSIGRVHKVTASDVEADWSSDASGFIEPDTNLTADAKWIKVVSRKQNRKCKPSVGLGNANKYASTALGSTLKEKEKMVTKENLDDTEIFQIAYGNGGVDVSIPEIDIIIDIRYKRFRTYGVEEKVEEKIDEKEKHKIDEILKKIDKESDGINSRFILPDKLPDVKYFLVEPEEDMECTYEEMTKRSLDIYYKRLFPNVESAHYLAIPKLWNKLPEVDSQYLRLFSKLWGLFDQKSIITYLESTSPTSRYENFVKAKETAKDAQLGKLGDHDISECLEDVFRERDIIALHNLKTEFDIYLLECMHCQDSPPKEFTPKTPIPVCRNVTYFCPRGHKMRFLKMMDKVKGLEMQLEAGVKLIKEHHKKSLEEDCSIRFRYVKLKRALAKDLGIISEETFRQELGDYLNDASVGAL